MSSPPFIAERCVPVPRCKYLSPEALAESRSEHYAVCAESGQPRGRTADEIAVGADGDRVGKLALGGQVAGNVLVERSIPLQFVTFPFVRIENRNRAKPVSEAQKC